jgi:hypothetical protein
VSRSSLLGLALLTHALLIVAPASAGSPADRLDRFRVLAASRLSLVEALDPERAGEAYREIHGLLDEEIVESLASGSVFAAPAFLQDRLDGFAEAWGGASLRLTRVGRFTVGAFQLGDGPSGSSVRVYGASAGEPQLLVTFQREGRPTVHMLPAAGERAVFLVVWEGVPTGRGTRTLRLDLIHELGDDAAVVWSTANLFPEGLTAREWRIRGGEVRIRYELHYPGWTPGCEPQTEQEDILKVAADGSGVARVSRRQHHGWHQALHRAVEGLLAALADGNRAALAALVPDNQVLQTLPPRLQREAACDAPDAPEPGAVSVAASAGEGGPWTLTFRRSGGQWRLTSATPVLQ